MTNWSSGYISGIDYTFEYHSEFNPVRAAFTLLAKGIACPEIKNACELGFGQGLSTVFNAAASDIKWYGTDFNTKHTLFANELSAAADLDSGFYNDSFVDFCRRDDLPDFDYIVFHGVWSWISEENRLVLIDFIRRKLKTGGLLYVSYNAHPGQAAFVPVQHLLTQYVELMTPKSDKIESRISAAIEFVSELIKSGSVFAERNPLVAKRLELMKSMPVKYLAHELFNKDWHITHFSTLSDQLDSTKVEFACSANILDQVNTINLTNKHVELVNSTADVRMSESIRDFLVDQQFRKDYWIKGVKYYSEAERIEKLRKQQVMLICPLDAISLEMKSSLGEISMSKDIYEPVIRQLSDYKAVTIDQLYKQLNGTEISFSQLVEVIVVLFGRFNLTIVPTNYDKDFIGKQSEKVNDFIIKRSKHHEDITKLLSPRTGIGVQADRIDQLALLANKEGITDHQELVLYVWNVFESQSQRLVIDGKLLESKDENLQEISTRITEFLESKLPVYQALNIV